MSNKPEIWQNPNGTWSHYLDRSREWIDYIGCKTDLQFAKDWKGRAK